MDVFPGKDHLGSHSLEFPVAACMPSNPMTAVTLPAISQTVYASPRPAAFPHNPMTAPMFCSPLKPSRTRLFEHEEGKNRKPETFHCEKFDWLQTGNLQGVGNFQEFRDSARNVR